MSEKDKDPLDEINAMKAVAGALKGLDRDETERVLAWACGRFGVAPTPRGANTKEGSLVRKESATDDHQFASLADLYAATEPGTDADRALVGGYWFQCVESQEDFASQTINTALKNLGHGVSNITKAFETLKAQSPALVMQVRKSGTTQQARKKYKLTAAGQKAVKQLIGQRT